MAWDTSDIDSLIFNDIVFDSLWADAYKKIYEICKYCSIPN